MPAGNLPLKAISDKMGLVSEASEEAALREDGTPMADYDVVVIGAGLGGLSAGALLARQGRRVLVLEQGEQVGGCCSTFERDGYHFDTGASIVEAIRSLELVFEKLGTTFQQEVDLIPCDPVLAVVLRDGTRFCYPFSSAETGRVIARFSVKDGENWAVYTRTFEEFLREGGQSYFNSPMDTWGDLAGFVRSHPGFRRFLPLLLRSYQSVITQYFEHDAVQQSMAYQSFYAGLPPALASGAFALLPYEEHEGVFYPRGGMIEIPRALERCGRQCGMEVRLKSRVHKVLVRRRQVEGVALAEGTEITAPVVVANVNAKTLYLDLIGEEHLPRLVRYGIKSYRYSMSVPVVYLGLDCRPPLDAHHTLFPIPLQQMNEFWWNTYEKGQLPEQLFGLICCPTFSDPGLAPPGHHILTLILTPAPYRLAGTDWDREKPRLIERAIGEVSRLAFPDLMAHVQVADCATPLDYERRLLLPEGAIYGLQNDLTSQGVFRPSARSRSIRGLYLAGASAHPGGGVPTTAASGMIAAQLVEQHEG